MYPESPSWARLSWTSGKFSKKFGPDELFNFEGTGETWIKKENRGPWQWIEKHFVINNTDEICMLIVNGSSSTMVKIRPVVCNLRNYFICYKDIPEETPVNTCEEPTLTNPKFTKDPVKFLRTDSNSKYLYPENVFLAKPQMALEICAELKLEPADIRGLADYQHLVAFIKGYLRFILKNYWTKLFLKTVKTTIKSRGFKKIIFVAHHFEKISYGPNFLFSVLLGGTDKETTGVYTVIGSNELLPFQLFSLRDKAYYVKGDFQHF